MAEAGASGWFGWGRGGGICTDHHLLASYPQTAPSTALSLGILLLTGLVSGEGEQLQEARKIRKTLTRCR